jgi:hypothetical protein
MDRQFSISTVNTTTDTTIPVEEPSAPASLSSSSRSSSIEVIEEPTIFNISTSSNQGTSDVEEAQVDGSYLNSTIR